MRIENLNERNGAKERSNDSSHSAREALEAERKGKAFSDKMSQIKTDEGKKADSRAQNKAERELSNLFEQMSRGMSAQQNVVETFTDDNRHLLAGRDGVVVLEDVAEAVDGESAEEIEANLLDQLAEAVKVRVDRLGNRDEIKLDISSYLPGTTFKIGREADLFELDFSSNSPRSSHMLGANKEALAEKIKRDLGPEFKFRISIHNLS